MANSPRITSSVKSVMANAGSASGAVTSSATPQRPTTIGPRMRSRLLAEQPAGPNDEHQQHEQIHGCEREIGEVVVSEYLDEGNEERTNERAEETAHAAN